MNTSLILLLIIFISLMLYFFRVQYKKNKSKQYRILLIIFYLINYTLFFVLNYLITDTWTDFFIVNTCFLIINIMILSIYKDWFKSRLYIRVILSITIPIIIIYITTYVNRFVLISNVYIIITLLVLMYNEKNEDNSKRQWVEVTLLLTSFIAGLFLMNNGYFGENYNKPQSYTISKMTQELDISKDDIVRVGKDGGERGQTILVSFKTKNNYYFVHYKDSKIIEYKQID